MKVLASYDIQDNKTRNRVISYLENSGFIRVQKSVFLGECKLYLLRKVVMEIGGIIDETADSFYFFPICKEDYSRTVFITKKSNHRIFYEEILFL